MTVRKKKDKGICHIPECGQQAKVGGMCGACYSWWGRVQLLRAGELSDYLETGRFRAQRMLSRFGMRSKLPRRQGKAKSHLKIVHRKSA